MLDTLEIIEEIDTILTRLYKKDFTLEEVSSMRLDLSVLLTMLSDYIGEVHEQQGNAEYERKKFEAETVRGYREMKYTSADAEASAKIDSEKFYYDENNWKGLYRKLENKRQALLKVLDAMSSVGKNIEEGT